MKKLIWLWKCFWGTKFRIVKVKKGLKNNEILVYRHKIYIKDEEKGDE